VALPLLPGLGRHCHLTQAALPQLERALLALARRRERLRRRRRRRQPRGHERLAGSVRRKRRKCAAPVELQAQRRGV